MLASFFLINQFVQLMYINLDLTDPFIYTRQSMKTSVVINKELCLYIHDRSMSLVTTETQLKIKRS